jgi:4'-phosphopantetheinyl transferase
MGRVAALRHGIPSVAFGRRFHFARGMTLNCREGDLHVWTIDLKIDDEVRDGLLAILSAEERERASKFAAQADSRRFIAARGGLRRILGRYTGADPAALSFTYGEFGKPALDAPFMTNELRFNLSHAGDIALCAVTEGCEVGIDIELVREKLDVERIAERFFSPAERKLIAEASDPSDTFSRIWVRKEAYVKGTGRGVGADLTQFTVSPQGDVVPVEGPDEADADWVVREVPVPPGYRAAVATPGVLRLSMRRYIE